MPARVALVCGLPERHGVASKLAGDGGIESDGRIVGDRGDLLCADGADARARAMLAAPNGGGALVGVQAHGLLTKRVAVDAPVRRQVMRMLGAARWIGWRRRRR